MSRDRARLIGPDAIDFDPLRIDGRPVPASAEASSCPACAVIRWLGALGMSLEWGPGMVRAALIRQKTAPPAHVCRGEPRSSAWRSAWTLLPGIDQHGWLDEHHPLSARTVSAVLARRQAAPTASHLDWTEPAPRLDDGPGGQDLADPGKHPERDRVSVEADLETLGRLLDSAESQIERHQELLSRIERDLERG